MLSTGQGLDQVTSGPYNQKSHMSRVTQGDPPIGQLVA